MSRALPALLLIAFATPSAFAQTAGPYVSTNIGVSAGDGGAALAGGASVGYMATRRLGFELELGATAGLDMGDLGLVPDRPIGLVSPIPEPTLAANGRLLRFETNFLFSLAAERNLRVFILGGGGVANLHQNITYRYPEIVFPPDFTVVIGPLPPFRFETVERRFSRSESALSLSVGGIVEHSLGSRFAVGLDARYSHGFFSEGMHFARVVARTRWQF